MSRLLLILAQILQKFIAFRHRKVLFLGLQKDLRSTLTLEYGKSGEIAAGLFRGVKYDSSIAHPNNFNIVHMLGLYETNVQDVIARHIGSFSRFVDIGCGSGYYTVGVAATLGLPALGFDIDERQIEIARRFAEINAVTERARHETSPPGVSYGERLQNGDFCLVDIEGAEVELADQLRPEDFPKAAFLFECHETNGKSAASVRDYLRRRFEQTHNTVSFAEGYAADYGDFSGRGITRNDLVFLAREQRKYVQLYLLALPRSG